MTKFAAQDGLFGEAATQSHSLLLCVDLVSFSLVMSFVSSVASWITKDSRLQKTAVFVSMMAIFSIAITGAIINWIISIIIMNKNRIAAA